MAVWEPRSGASARVTTPAGASWDCGFAATLPMSSFARRLALALLCALACVWTLAGAQAQAAFSRHTFVGSFGPEGPISLASFANVQGVAVDAEGDVYVYDTEAAGGSVYKFNSVGEPVNFSALGTNVITGVGHANTDENELAVDYSSGPAKGDIYVANGTDVGIYGPDGDPVEVKGKPAQLNGEVQTEVPGAPWGEPCGVAVDAAGDVYVGLASGHVNRYAPVASPVVNTDYTASLWGLDGEICNIAADPAGDVYADTYRQGPVNRYETSQFNTEGTAAAGVEVDPVGSTLAADPSPSGHILYIDEREGIAEYESSGEPRRRGEFGDLEPGLLNGQSFGVAVGPAGRVYASSGSGLIDIYGLTPARRPIIDDESATDVTATTGTLDAEIDPALYDTHYYFQWGTADCAEDPSACTDVPASPGADIGSGESDVSVSTELRGLAPGAVYHYRVIAENANGTIEGPDATLTTRPPATAGSTLLDGRAYELVSPPEKEGGMLLRIGGFPGPTGGGVIQAEPEGDALTYVSNEAFAEPVSSALSDQYLATRGAGGWSNVNVTPPMRSEGGTLNEGGPYRVLSSDLSSGLLLRREGEPSLDPRAPGGFENYVLRTGLRTAGSGGFQAALLGPVAEQLKVELEGANPELTHIVLRATGYSPREAEELFEWTPGGPVPELQAISADAILGEDRGGNPEGTNAISDDGSRVYYTTGGNLYLREDGMTTVEVDATREKPEEDGSGLFHAASSDGSRAFFTDTHKLTANAGGGPESGKEDLYMFEAASGTVTDIAPSGDVLGVLGTSEDGSYVYFVANGVLASGASPGRCRNEQSLIESRTCNLYVWHDGTTRFIATLSDADEGGGAHKDESPEGLFYAGDWNPVLEAHTARVSPDGEDVVFMADGDLTSYDSRSAETDQPEQEVYLYDAVSGVLRCVSCNPTGARPEGPSAIPGGTPYELGQTLYQSRVLSDEGGRARVFFDSADGLAPQDTNGELDLYEWEEDERGTCAQAGGCLGLISSGASSQESVFLDASADGDDVFFLTYAKLAPQDTDNLADIYDARAPHVPGEVVGSPAAVPAPPPCDNGDSCKPPASAQPGIFGAPASATFTGLGNPPGSAQTAKRLKSKSSTRPEKLRRALRACGKKSRHRRMCDARARRRHGFSGNTDTGRRTKGRR